MFEQGFSHGGLDFPRISYESNVLFALRFMIDHNVGGGNWITLPAGAYRLRTKHATVCQLEADIR